MDTAEKLLLIIAYQLSGEHDSRGRRICPLCGVIGWHIEGCELGEMEKWVKGELSKLWRTEVSNVR